MDLVFIPGEDSNMVPPHSFPGRDLALLVGGGAGVLALVEPLLQGRAYDVEFVQMDDEPFGTVLAMRPALVIVSLGLDDPDAFALLSMLRLDPRTSDIAVLTYVRESTDVVFDLLEGAEGVLAPLQRLAAPVRH